ncbi:four-carbon acid sugar kinase family protein [Lacrimispora defluvii]|uniref:Four-carbon acid sugar kinase family protein n=1 Tax=Lacrimispora defluvii TaxID=2719233 RepID=A0ABX1VWM2_9FIRM|nr:four-carbon acid sugar kinase family protein [Lacrimispora defluvii]NNJ30766.1 four-carbon acid sugar kinase family protein [Lacrimispora defluvii]
MIKLLIISDDFTGALDTGVQLSADGAATCVTLDSDFNMSDFTQDIDVLVINTETRHLNRDQAYKIVFSITRRARNAGIPYIYKKTDSVLRGNIGAELAAVLNASGYKQIHFIPAYPEMGRITKNGVHYADGVPIADSIFGNDPFEPVLYSDIPSIISSQTLIPTHVINQLEDEEWKDKEGILIHDSHTTKDMERIAHTLMTGKNPCLLAGCAGFAAVLPKMLGIQGGKPVTPVLSPHMFIACASIHPVSLAQCEDATQKGVPQYVLSPKEKLDHSWIGKGAYNALVNEILHSCEENPVVILNANGSGEPDATYQYAKENGITQEQLRTEIVSVMGYMIEALLDKGLDATAFLMGGDLLYQFAKQTGIKVISPICELEKGVVLSEAVYKGKNINLISKSGGFGQESLFTDLSKQPFMRHMV